MKNKQKGGKVIYQDGSWIGTNPSGKADALLFNYLGLSGTDLLYGTNGSETDRYFQIWKYPLIDEGLMNSSNWINDNRGEILKLLNNIIEVRTNDMDVSKLNYEKSNKSVSRLKNYNTKARNHINLLAYIKQLKLLIENPEYNTVDLGNLRDFETILNNMGFNIEDTPGFDNVKTQLENTYIIESSTSGAAEQTSRAAENTSRAAENTSGAAKPSGAAKQRGGTKRKKMIKKKKKSKTKKEKKKKKSKTNYWL